MPHKTISIFLPKEVDTSEFPDSLYGTYSGSLDYKVESSWMFFLMLRNQGFNVQICSKIPDAGILLMHKAFARKFLWKPNLFVVSMQWDYKRDDRGQVHLVSNYMKTRASALGWMDRLTLPGFQFFVQPPMHPDLVPRDVNRGNRFEKIAFLGAEKNLESAFRSADFRSRVDALGMQFEIVNDPSKMNVYSDIDAVLAVRRLGKTISHKPAQKLINAWRAGAPAILGREVGYQELHDSDVDYLEVDSVDDVIRALEKLKTSDEFRASVIKSGLEKSEDYTAEAIELRWSELFRDRIIPAYFGWMAQPKLDRNFFLVVRWFRHVSRVGLSFIWHKLLGVQARS